MPSFIQSGEAASIECDIDRGRQNIAAIVFYKDNQEIYRYTAGAPNPVTILPAYGVTINMRKMYKREEIELINTSPMTSGVYTCKVLMNHPQMSFAQFSGHLKVF
ncbi:hypothetical protein FQA39_LY11563 [Lamprigera yunnana]|nr:hypothetical protein FQA39_LY11563 [Lamprigera yunnana]